MTMPVVSAILAMLAALLAVLAAVGAAACFASTRRKTHACLCKISGVSARLSAVGARLEEQEKKLEAVAWRREGDKAPGTPEKTEEQKAEKWMQGLSDILAYTGALYKKEERPD